MRRFVMLVCLVALTGGAVGCGLHKSTPPQPGQCQERRLECDSCSKEGILGARHIHPDCTETCDMICGRREGY